MRNLSTFKDEYYGVFDLICVIFTMQSRFRKHILIWMDLETESVSSPVTSTRCNEYRFLQLEFCGEPLGLYFSSHIVNIVCNHKLSAPRWNMMKYQHLLVGPGCIATKNYLKNERCLFARLYPNVILTIILNMLEHNCHCNLDLRCSCTQMSF